MNHHQFRLLSFDVQLAYVWREGSHLATRWQDELPVLLYHLPGGFFAELTYEPASNAVMKVYSFVNGEPLGKYADFIALPEM